MWQATDGGGYNDGAEQNVAPVFQASSSYAAPAGFTFDSRSGIWKRNNGNGTDSLIYTPDLAQHTVSNVNTNEMSFGKFLGLSAALLGGGLALSCGLGGAAAAEGAISGAPVTEIAVSSAPVYEAGVAAANEAAGVAAADLASAGAGGGLLSSLSGNLGNLAKTLLGGLAGMGGAGQGSGANLVPGRAAGQLQTVRSTPTELAPINTLPGASAPSWWPFAAVGLAVLALGH